MTFYNFIQKFIDEDSPIGDLAYDIKRDGNFPTTSEDHLEIKTYLFSKTKDVTILNVMNHAIESYRIIKREL